MTPPFEHLDSQVSFRGKVIKAGTERFRHDDGEEVVRDEVWHPAGWDELFCFYTSPGFADERVWLYLATDLTDVTETADAEEDERIEIVPWPLSRLEQAIIECRDSKSLIGLLWLAWRRIDPQLPCHANRQTRGALPRGPE